MTYLVVQGGRLCLHTDAAIWLISRLLERHQDLGDPCGATEGLLAEHIEMSCYFSHLSALSGRGEFKESLKSGFLLLHPVETLELL